MMEAVNSYLRNRAFSLPQIGWNDLIEVMILAYIIYHVLLWVRRNRAWSLVKGLLIMMAAYVIADFFEMTTITYLLGQLFQSGILAFIIIFQPELRRVLEQVGRKSFPAIWSGMVHQEEQRFSDRTVDALVRASAEMSKAKTGALMVIEQNQNLDEFISTGIQMDSLISYQLILQIFEHNTPLHDGAAILRGDRVIAATCYLPLSENMSISKELGTRHRAAVGISEVSDSVTIIVSEETGGISLAVGGEIIRNMEPESLRSKLLMMQKAPIDVKRFRLWKGNLPDEETEIGRRRSFSSILGKMSKKNGKISRQSLPIGDLTVEENTDKKEESDS